MYRPEQIKAVITAGADFLHKQQLPNGSFLSFTVGHNEDSTQLQACPTVFSSALILQSLTELSSFKQYPSLITNLTTFLSQQMNEYATCNYWDRQSQEYEKQPYPDDLDDTACALAGLFLHKESLITGAIMGGFTKILQLLETTPGGPYKTWLVKNSAEAIWHEVDLAVNTNVAYILSLLEVTLPPLQQYIEQAILNDKIESPFYCSEFPIIYFMSRLPLSSNAKIQLAKKILSLQNTNQTWNTPLNTAFALLTLDNLNVPSTNYKKAYTYIFDVCHSQTWQWEPMYVGIKPLAGSPALTATYCLQTLHRFYKQTQEIPTQTTNQTNTIAQRLHNNIQFQIRNRFTTCIPALAKPAQILIEKIDSADPTHTITLLPYYFAQSLHNKTKPPTPENILIQCGLANLYGWTAYTVYDNFFDDQPTPQLLPIANLCLREMTQLFDRLLNNTPAWRIFYNNIIDQIDSANAWEVTHCRLAKNDPNTFNIPDHGLTSIPLNHLAHRSLGHALGPIAILAHAGYSLESPAVTHTLNFFTHYIIARQLNDDAHDWEVDLNHGHITYVTKTLLDTYFHQINTKPHRITPKKITGTLKKLFWYEVIPHINQEITHQLSQAESNLNATNIITNRTYLESLLQKIRNSVTKTEDERTQTLAFINRYNKPETHARNNNH